MEGLGENLMGLFNSPEQNAAPVQETQQEAPEQQQEETSTEQQVEVPATEVTPEEEQQAPATETATEQQAAEPAQEEVKPLEINDDAVLEYLKKTSGKDISSLKDLFKEPEQAADPFEGLSDEAVQFLKYNKETGRDFNDFNELNADYSKLTPLQVAEKRVIELSGGELQGEEIYQYLEKKLNIDLSDPSAIDKFDLIELKNFGKDFLERKIAGKEQYKQPVERPAAQQGPEMVTLENGVQMPKADYDNAVSQHQSFEKSLKDSTDNITSSDFKIKIDDNGTESILDLSYDYSKDEKHSMFSSALDANKSIQEMFTTDKGFDHASYQQAMFRANPANFGKIVSSLINKARAEWITESVKDRTNANFNTKQMPSGANGSGKGIVIPGTQNNVGIKYDFNNI